MTDAVQVADADTGRQQDWLRELLQLRPSGFDPLVSTHYEDEDGELQHGSWDEYDGRAHCDQRNPWPNEIVLDYDGGDQDERQTQTRKIVAFLQRQEIPFFVADSGGTGYHVHIFFSIASVDDWKEYRVARQALYRLLKADLAEDGVDVDALDDGVVEFNRVEGNGHLIRPVGGRHPETGRHKSAVDPITLEKQDADTLRDVQFPGDIEQLTISDKGFVDSAYTLDDIMEKAKEIHEQERVQWQEQYTSTYQAEDDGLAAARNIPAHEVLQALGKDVTPGDTICCPGHDDNTPSMNIIGRKAASRSEHLGGEFVGVAACWGECGTPGEPEYYNAIDLVMAIKDWNFQEAVDWLEETFDIDVDTFFSVSPEAFFEPDENDSLQFQPAKLRDYILDHHEFLPVWDGNSFVGLYLYEDGYYQNIGVRRAEQWADRLLGETVRNHYVREVSKSLQRQPGIEVDDLGGPSHLLNVENGLVDIHTRRLQDHTPEIYSATRLPVEYNPDADCPKFKDFLADTLYEDDIATVQEMFGYCLLEDVRFEKAFMLLGEGRNGKSTLLDVLSALLGEENVADEELQDLTNSRWGMAQLYNRMANISADIPSEKLRSSSRFKALVSGDGVSAEFKGQDKFEFRNKAKLIFSANNVPETPDDTDAFFRRWILIRFPYKFKAEPDPENEFEKEAEPNLDEKLTTEEELSGILNWALEGLQRLLEQGQFSGASSTAEVRESWMRQANSVKAFASEFLIGVDADDADGRPKHYLFKNCVYARYQDFCEEQELETKERSDFFKDLLRFVPEAETNRRRIDGDRERLVDYVRWAEDDAVDQVVAAGREEGDYGQAARTAAELIVTEDLEKVRRNRILEQIAEHYNVAFEDFEKTYAKEVEDLVSGEGDDDEDGAEDVGKSPDDGNSSSESTEDGTDQQDSGNDNTANDDPDTDILDAEDSDDAGHSETRISTEQATSSSDDDLVQVNLVADVPEFMGVDMQVYGPYEDGDTAELPPKNADVLEDQGKAERLE